MTRITRFAASDPGPASRVTGFLTHLRAQGFHLGVAEADTAMRALTQIPACDINQTRLALKTVCCGCADDSARFDLLFESYWVNAGRVREKSVPNPDRRDAKHTRSSRKATGQQADRRGTAHAPDATGGADVTADGTGRLVAARSRNLMKKDLRDLVDPDDIREAEQVAHRLGQALRDRRSRRRRAAKRGTQIDLRRTIRQSLSTGGEPMRLVRRRRPDRPVRIATLCDVSGSMMAYARPFLAFLAGMMRADPVSDAYLFHTRLVRISDALRDPDPLRALNRVTLLADGMGGGSRIGGNMDRFARTYARHSVDGRSVLIILSDGYDSDPPDMLDAALARIAKRGCRIVWLNPLKGWAGYEPVARGMAAALPHLDLFRAANTLDDLAALETALESL